MCTVRISVAGVGMKQAPGQVHEKGISKMSIIEGIAEQPRANNEADAMQLGMTHAWVIPRHRILGQVLAD